MSDAAENLEAFMDEGLVEDVNIDDSPDYDDFDDIPEEYESDVKSEDSVSEDKSDNKSDDNDETASEDKQLNKEDVDSKNGSGEEDSEADKVEDAVEKEEVKEEEGKEEEKEEELSLESLQEQIEKGELNIKHKVDGEEVELSLQELKDNYAGKVAYDKKFSELDVKTKAHENDLKEVNEYISNFGAKMKDGDVIGAFQYFGQFADIPPYMIKEQLMAALKPELMRRQELSTDELANEMLKAQNEHLLEKQESESKQREKEASQSELQSSINSIREARSIEETEWNDALKYLDESLEPDVQITPSLVEDFILQDRAYNLVDKTIQEVDSSIAGNAEFEDMLQKLILDNPSFTEQQIKDIVTEASSASKKQKASEKLKQKVSKSEPKKVEKKVEIAEEDMEDLDWDDLE